MRAPDIFDSFVLLPMPEVSLGSINVLLTNLFLEKEIVPSRAPGHVGGVITEALIPVEDQGWRAEGLPSMLGSHPACAEAVLAGTEGDVATLGRAEYRAAGIIA